MIPVIIQASNRNESIKDRNKCMINGIPEIVFLVNRVKKKFGNDVIVATSDTQADDELVEMLDSIPVKIFRGDFEDILQRLLSAANQNHIENFVRIYGNYPLIDLEQAEMLAEEHIKGEYDYSYNEHKNGVLWGTGCDAFSVKTLEQLNEQLHDHYQRNMVSFYLQQNTSSYKILKKCVMTERPGYKLNFETEKDFKVIQEIVNSVPELNNANIISYIKAHPVIAAYNLESPPKEVGIEKLFLHSEKVKDILENGVYAGSYPISVELTLTNTCNLKCVYCSDEDLRARQGKNAHLDYETLSRLFRDLADGGTKGVVFEGGGEPTLHPDFEKLVCCAKENGLGIGLITNGTSTLSSDILPYFEWIRVSLDASNAEEYLALKKVDFFERVLSNIAHYSRYCKTVGVGYVVTNNNMSNIETLIMRLREIGASYVQMRPVVDMPELLPKERDLKYLECYKGTHFNVVVDGMQENMDRGNGNLPCVANSITSVISGDGSVYLCGRLNIYNWIPAIGNIKENTFAEIWHGEERKKQLTMAGEAEFCAKNCPQCRVSKFNQLFDRLSKTKSVHFI